MNIFNYAMQMEQDGQAFYERLAADAIAEGLKTIFNSLAVDESKHYELFKQMKDAAGELSMVDSTALDGAKTIFAELQKKGSALSPDTKSLEAYRYAMQVEEDSATLYQEAAEKETNPQIRELLLRIATEERKHLNILENVFEFVNAPNQSLVWGEFSNLKEF